MESPTKTLFEEEKATLAVLIFLRGSKVGEVVSLVALGRGRGVEDLVGEEGEEGAGLPMHENVLYSFPMSSPVQPSSSPSSPFLPLSFIFVLGSPTLTAGRRVALRVITRQDGVRSCP